MAPARCDAGALLMSRRHCVGGVVSLTSHVCCLCQHRARKMDRTVMYGDDTTLRSCVLLLKSC